MHTAGFDLLQRFKRDGYQGVRDFNKLFPNALDRKTLDRHGTQHIREMEEKYLPAEMLKKYEVTPAGHGVVEASQKSVGTADKPHS